MGQCKRLGVDGIEILAQVHRHLLSLPLRHPPAAGAVLGAARGHNAIAAWAAGLSQQARARFRCLFRHGCYEVPDRTRFFREGLIRLDPRGP